MNMHDNGHKPKQPPQGLLAKEIMDKASPANVPVFPSIDASYHDPESFAELQERASKTLPEKYIPLIADLLKRIKALEEALMPFGTHALMLANMSMCLQAAGRGDEPVGGCWINGINNANLQSNSHIFFLAADILGRKHVEARVMTIFESIQKAAAAEKERDEHVANQHLEGPIGGPVSGKIH